jgi:hypothetical protein
VLEIYNEYICGSGCASAMFYLKYKEGVFKIVTK